MLTTIRIDDLIVQIQKPWDPIEVARVNDQVIRLAMFKGEYPFHKHDNEDELFYVIKGKITIRLENGKKIVLHQGDVTVVPKGQRHSPKSHIESYVLMFEPFTLKSRGD